MSVLTARKGVRGRGILNYRKRFLWARNFAQMKPVEWTLGPNISLELWKSLEAWKIIIFYLTLSLSLSQTQKFSLTLTRYKDTSNTSFETKISFYCYVSNIFSFKVTKNLNSTGDPSAPSILRPRVRIPNTYFVI